MFDSKRNALLDALGQLGKTGGKVIRDLEGLQKYVPYAEQALWLALQSKTQGQTPIPLPPLLVQGMSVQLGFQHNGQFLCMENVAHALGTSYNLDLLAGRYSRTHWLSELEYPHPTWTHAIAVCCWKMVDGTPTIVRQIFAAGPNNFDMVAQQEAAMEHPNAKERPVKSYAPLATTNPIMGLEVLALQRRQEFDILHVCGTCGHGIDANGKCTRCLTQVAPKNKVERRRPKPPVPFELAAVGVPQGQKPFKIGRRYQDLGF